MPKTARDVAVDALLKWEQEHTFSNVMLDHWLRDTAMSAEDAAFTTRLVYGVIERLLTVDWLLGKAMRRPLASCQPTVRAILRVGVYQLVYMQKIPSSAAVNEAVNQAKRYRQASAAGFVNGVLRTVDREHERLLRSIPTDWKGISLLHSVPVELLKLWGKAYGRDNALALAASANDAPPSVLRVNTLRTTEEAFLEALAAHHLTAQPIDGLDGAYTVADAAPLRRLTDLKDLYFFQDAASQWACKALMPEAGERILDMCAAPGGKTFTTAMRLGGEGYMVSCDIYEHKTATIRERARSLGATCVQTVCRDAAQPLPAEWEGAFDRVICDVPCSGYGVIRRRPEIRYKPLFDSDDLPSLQYAILCRAAQAVRPGGVVQYSTCTLCPRENEQIAARFLEEHPEFAPRELPLPTLFEASGLTPSHQLTMMPHVHGTDGFFVASFRKEGSV